MPFAVIYWPGPRGPGLVWESFRTRAGAAFCAEMLRGAGFWAVAVGSRAAGAGAGVSLSRK